MKMPLSFNDALSAPFGDLRQDIVAGRAPLAKIEDAAGADTLQPL